MREGDGNMLLVSHVADLQPEDPCQRHAYLSPSGFGVSGDPRLCRLSDEGWVECGEAPSFNDESLHPDLPHAIAEYVALARRVIRRINGHATILVTLDADGSIDSGFDVKSDASFMCEGGNGMRSGIDERTLDGIPDVRYVEREGCRLAEMLCINAHDDGSGVDGDAILEIGEESMRLTFDDRDGCMMTLSSTLGDSGWIHATDLRFADTGDHDAVANLRRMSQPEEWLTECLSGREAISHVMIGESERRAVITHHAAEEEAWTFAIRPGTLLAHP